MKRSTNTVLIFSLIFFVLSFAAAYADQGDKAVTVAGILEQAKCPLDAEQAKKLKDFKPGGERGAFRALFEIFNDTQIDALKKVFGASQGRNGGPERPRFLSFAVMFDNAGCSFTEAQIEKIKALPQERGAFQKLRDLLNDKQKELTQDMFNR